jgi:hypothetical protein
MRWFAIVGAVISVVLVAQVGTLRGDLGKETEAEMVARLIKQLGDDAFAKREAATEQLKALGEPALEALRKAAASDSDPEIRARAERIIQAIAPAGEQEYSPVVAWGELKIFARAHNGRLIHRAYDADNKTWSKWEPLGDNEITSSPCALMTPGDRLAVFFRGTDGKMYHRFQDKGQPWSEVRGHWARALSSAPSAIVLEGGLLTVFARSKEGKLMPTYYDAKGWTEWEDID